MAMLKPLFSLKRYKAKTPKKTKKAGDLDDTGAAPAAAEDDAPPN
jgi:hypothetical protein